MNRRKVFDFCIPEQMDVKDDKKMKMKGRTKRCKTKKKKSWSKEMKTQVFEICSILENVKVIRRAAIFTLFLEKTSRIIQVMEGCRLPEKRMELKQTSPFFYIFDLDLKCTPKSIYSNKKRHQHKLCTQ